VGEWLKLAVVFGILVLAAIGATNLHIPIASSVAPTPVRGQAGGAVAEIERSTTELFERVSPSVVEMAVFARAGDPPTIETRIGSGFAWDAAGNIVTNEHVVRGADTIVVWLVSGERAEGKVVGATADYDLAVVRLKSGSRLPPPIVVGDSSDLKIGQFGYAIGSPFGLDQSLTTGVVSALNRYLPTDNGGMITHVIQTDAATFPGNSGGPLLDSSGRLIGVNTIGYSLTGLHGALAFAIPAETVKRVVPKLISDGYVSLPSIGVIPADKRVAAGLAIDGVAIARIEPGSPADQAGLRASNLAAGLRGDVITAANGRPTRNPYDLLHQLEQLGVGKRIGLTINRDDKQAQIELEIVDRGGKR
jgi:S1-C subfamily serine protease